MTPIRSRSTLSFSVCVAALPAIVSTATVCAQTTLVPAGAVWRYVDDGSNQGAAWRAVGFADAGWASGPAELGYGDGDEATVVGFGPDPNNKYMTTYFRHAFQVVDASLFTWLRLRIVRDDGAVVYLNGTEVLHSNTRRPLNHLTRAFTSMDGIAESGFETFYIDATLLQNGTNVLAVEIHQWQPDNDDISFDAELVAGAGRAFVIRGPYLQRGAHDSAVVRWRTSVPAETVVFTGPAPGSLSIAFNDPTPRIDHEAVLTGLTPDTRSFYAVGDAAGILAGDDADHYFVTHPTPGTARPTRIWVVGDSGTAADRPREIRDAYLGFTAGRDTDAFLMLGDNAYPFGTDTDHQTGLFDVFQPLLRNTFLWPSLGNHDTDSSDGDTETGPYFDMFTLPRNAESGGQPSGTEAWYSFDHGDIHFVCLDSDDVDRSTGGAMLSWLAADLASAGATARWMIAYWHHPPYSKGGGGHDSDGTGPGTDLRQNAVPLLEAAGVDVVMSGHAHAYERSYLLDGHYGTSNTLTPSMIFDLGDGTAALDGVYAKPTLGLGAREGAIYIVAGSAGFSASGNFDHPAMYTGGRISCSVVIDVAGDRMDLTTIDQTGSAVDRVTIVKGLNRTLKRDLPAVSLAAGDTQNLFLDAGPGLAGKNYIVASSSRTEPGLNLGSVVLPLDPTSVWFALSTAVANSPTYQNTLGTLDPSGRAQAAIALPNLAVLAGLSVHHAYLGFDATQLLIASNPVRMRILP